MFACQDAFCRERMTAMWDDADVKGLIVHPDDADFIRHATFPRK